MLMRSYTDNPWCITGGVTANIPIELVVDRTYSLTLDKGIDAPVSCPCGSTIGSTDKDGVRVVMPGMSHLWR